MNNEGVIRFLAILGIVIGLAGAGAGGTAIYFHMKGQEATAKADARVADLEQKIAAIPEQISGTENNLRSQFQNQLQNVAQSQEGVLNGLRTDINALHDQVTALTNKPAPVEPPPQQPSVDAAAPQPPAGPGGTYVIQSGDNFGKIAKKAGTTSAALVNANPGVDPARLKIGQKINLP